MKFLVIITCLFIFISCEFEVENEYKSFVEKRGTLDSNNWEVLQRENIKFIHNKSWIKSEATGILFTSFFDSSRNEIYTITKVKLKKYSANQYIKSLTSYFKNDTNIKIFDYSINELIKNNSRILLFSLDYRRYLESRINYELLYEYNGFLYSIGLNMKKNDNKVYTGMKYNSEQLFQLLITKSSVDNELIIKNNENLKSIKELKLEDLE